MKKSRKDRIRQVVIARDGNICCYCDKILADDEITIEHLVPKKDGGKWSPSNLTIACLPCNNARGATPFWEYPPVSSFEWSKAFKYRRLLQNNLTIRVLTEAKLCMRDNRALRDVISEAAERTNIIPPDLSAILSGHSIPVSWDAPEQAKTIRRTCENLIHILNGKSL